MLLIINYLDVTGQEGRKALIVFMQILIKFCLLLDEPPYVQNCVELGFPKGIILFFSCMLVVY